MFVVTFYSYKGGVGRTSALVNVAAFLASRNKRVLIVDFDLEAPGIPTYAQFAKASDVRGLVDYVCEYVATSVAPIVSDFIVECDLGANFGPVWVMPAGRQDETYSHKLSSIDWQELYTHRSGYLFFEDLKQQWQDVFDFDYVLIDSRTGHTDVGGICTRQLADTDVMMFLPTFQNITGMKSVVDEIKIDLTIRNKQVTMLFVPANVPYLDDEYGILAKNIDLSAKLLGFEVPSATIHHYDSMSLIDSAIFSLSRPKSRLASEYGVLHDAIVSSNFDDRYAALKFLKDFRRRVSDYSPEIETGTHQLEGLLGKISQAHIGDAEIAMGLASAYSILGQESAELEALNVVIENEQEAVEARLRRARLLAGRGQRDNAKDDLIAIFAGTEAPARILSSGVELLMAMEPDWLGIARASPAVRRLTGPDVEVFGRSLMVSRSGCDLAAELIGTQIQLGASTGALATSDYGLALIGSAQFVRAYTVYDEMYGTSGLSDNIVVLFNLAMAEWGVKGAFDRDKLSRILQLDDGDTGNANYQQCLALCLALLGDSAAALERLDAAKSSITPGRTFSCWTYFYRNRREMVKDIVLMEEAIASGNVIPAFLPS